MNWSAVETALVPAGVATVTSTWPAACAGEVAVTSVPETTEKVAAATVPNRTVLAPVKPVPAMVTAVAPATGPTAGLRALMAGPASEVNRSDGLVALVPLGVVTVTATVPALAAGETAVTSVAEMTEKLSAAAEPKLTPVAPTKAVPVMVTEVPPVRGPDRGVSELTTGAGW